MEYGIFHVRIENVNACDCTQECTDTVRESALNVESRRKITSRTGESKLRQRRASPTLYRLSGLYPHPYLKIEALKKWSWINRGSKTVVERQIHLAQRSRACKAIFWPTLRFKVENLWQFSQGSLRRGTVISASVVPPPRGATKRRYTHQQTPETTWPLFCN